MIQCNCWDLMPVESAHGHSGLCDCLLNFWNSLQLKSHLAIKYLSQFGQIERGISFLDWITRNQDLMNLGPCVHSNGTQSEQLHWMWMSGGQRLHSVAEQSLEIRFSDHAIPKLAAIRCRCKITKENYFRKYRSCTCNPMYVVAKSRREISKLYLHTKLLNSVNQLMKRKKIS